MKELKTSMKTSLKTQAMDSWMESQEFPDDLVTTTGKPWQTQEPKPQLNSKETEQDA